MNHITRINALLCSIAALALALAGCSGGAATTQNPDTQSPTVSTYSGPAAGTADVHAFEVNLWQNITASNRCGNCHKAAGQSPMFARSDDVNLAYNDALGVVNLVQPDQSRMVVKVAGGHNCWLSSAQACADILTTWIRNWAGGAVSGGTQIQLQAPADVGVGSSKTFPSDSTLFASTLHPLLMQFCARCHSASAASPVSPYFASSDVAEAYAAAKAKINLDTITLSRFYVRLHDENHNCWGTPVNCANSSATMLTQLQAFASGIPVTQVDPALVLSRALTLYDGTVASGGNRYDTNVIAKYQFKEGNAGVPCGVAYDTSGVEPALNLTLSGDYSCVGGWGIQFGPNGGKAQGSVATSRKIYDQTRSAGEYSIELWAAPANVAQEDAYLASYSGGAGARNFTLSQHAYQYEAFGRSSATDSNGAPALLTRDADRDAQASLQHVVLTYSPVNGRRLYVNGNYTGDVDARSGGTLGNWDDTFAFLFGNETSGANKWAGTLRFAAVYNRALTQPQVQQNFAAGVGERYYLLFNVSSLTGMSQSYVMFEVSRYDSYSYLFNKPVFISLDSAAHPGSIPIQGVRIGINGREASAGQAYATVNTTVTDANYVAGTGQRLSDIGTVIALEKGPDSDQFFLSFERIGSRTNAHTEPTPVQPVPPASTSASADVGVRVFSEINASLSEITGVPTTDTNVRATYALVEQQLPVATGIDGFLASHQVGIAQLAIQYCDALVESNQAGTFFPNLNLGAAPGTAFADPTRVTAPLLARGVGSNLATQPADVDVANELNNLISNLSASAASPSCTGACRTRTITKAACAAVLGSAAVLIK